MQDDPKNVKKTTGGVSQYLWYGGVLMAGGLTALTFALLYSKKSNDVKELEQQIRGNEIVYIREIDSLANEVKQVTDKYIFLQSDNETLNNNLAKEQSRNKFLASANSSLATRESQYRNSYSSLQASAAKANAENKALKEESTLLRSQVQYLQTLLDERDKTITRQQSRLDEQSSRIELDNMALTSLRDSVESEKVSGYYINPEITGSFGLAEITAPYARYFYGLNVVNGYVINKHWSTGVGVGVYSYNSGWLVPLYLDFRYRIRLGNFTPYVYADGGFMFDFQNFRLPNTLFMNPGVGLYKSLNDHWALNIGVGPFVQLYDYRASFINMKIGITYKKR